MANVFLNLPAPAGPGVGAWVDVSSMGPERTISVDGGDFSGSIFIEGSNDAQASAVPVIGPFVGPTSAPQTFTQGWNFLRVRRTADASTGAPTVNLAGPAAIASTFGAVDVPAGDGVGAPFSVAGGGDVNTFGVAGAFQGQILIEASTDGASFSPALLFEAGDGAAVTMLGVLSAVRVRRRGNSTPAPLVSVGSQATSGAAGGGFPGYGAAPPAIAAAGASGASGVVSRSDHTHAGTASLNGAAGAATLASAAGTIVITGVAPALNIEVALGTVGSMQTVASDAALSALPAAGFGSGNTWCYHQARKAYFCLVASTQAASAGVRVAASGKAGFLWLRVIESTAWWSQLSWFVDPLNTSGTASDENTGASTALPLATCAEFNRRFKARALPGTETNSFALNLMSDAADTDYFQVHLDSNYRNVAINVSVNGTVTASAIGVIASAVAKNAATNAANSITVTGFDFATLVGRVIRLVGSPLITAVIEAAPSLGVAQLSEQNNSNVVGAGFTAGQTVELCTLPKLAGCVVTGSGSQVNVSDVRANPATLSFWTVEGVGSQINFFRSELRGTAGGIVRATTINLVGCGMTGATWELRGTSNGIASSMINCPNVVIGQGAVGTDSRGTWRGMGAVNSYIGLRPYTQIIMASDFHTYSAAANKCVISLDATASVIFNVAFYGSGNAASSAGVGLPVGGWMIYSTATVPSNDCGQAVYHGGNAGVVPAPTTGGASVAYGTPLAITAKLNAVAAI